MTEDCNLRSDPVKLLIYLGLGVGPGLAISIFLIFRTEKPRWIQMLPRAVSRKSWITGENSSLYALFLALFG